MSWPHDTLAPGRRCRERDLDRAMERKTCAACAGACPVPEACQLPIARATKPPRTAFWMAAASDSIQAQLHRFFFLEPYLARYPWLGPVLVTCVVVIWTCVDAYLEATP
jgi:hypothetical protein